MNADLKAFKLIPALSSVKFTESRGPHAGWTARVSVDVELTRIGKFATGVCAADNRRRRNAVASKARNMRGLLVRGPSCDEQQHISRTVVCRLICAIKARTVTKVVLLVLNAVC
jgi:hypothetical protein